MLSKAKKILIIDFDLENNNLYSVFGVNKIPKELKEKIKDENFLEEFCLKEKNIQKLIIKVYKNLDIISCADIIFGNKYLYKKEGIEEMLNELKRQYELIFLDISRGIKNEKVTSVLLERSDKIVCLTGGNMLEIKKTISILNDNQKDKIFIIYNKKNKYTMKTKIIELLLLKFKIIGTLDYDIRYNQIINKNMNKLYISKKIRNEYIKIMEKLKI
ncbi:MAG: ParA family protein [Clostridia bacterium]|jgi:MinD-like ATPase involved in chromosome partitioning or flagellar assembly|nr:ParA family protein [Clostridia bacterium]